MIKKLFICAVGFCLLVVGVETAKAGGKVAVVKGCEIAFTPGDGAFNTILTQLDHATSTVDVAVARLTNLELVDALCILARDRKVAVRVILDAYEISTPEDGAAYDYLRERLAHSGVKVWIYSGTNQKGISNKMHLRCAVIDGTNVITGSLNWRADVFRNKCDDLIVLHSPNLAAAYLDEMDQIVKSSSKLTLATPAIPEAISFPALHKADDGSTPGALTVKKAFKAAVYFSPDNSGFGALMEQISAATNQVDIAMRLMTHKKLNNTIVALASNGIPVRLALDKDMFRQMLATKEKVLEQPGITIYGSQPKEPGLHLKVSIIDRNHLWTGSANGLNSADTRDIEDMLQIESPEVAAAYGKAFDRLAQWFEKAPANRHKNGREKNKYAHSPASKPRTAGTDQNTTKP